MKRVFFLMILLGVTIFLNAVIYVDIANNTGIEDGTSSHPFNTIQEGIDSITNLTAEPEIVVASGDYYGNLGITFEDCPNQTRIIMRSSTEDPTQCKIIGDGTENVILLGAENGYQPGKEVIITGFTISNSGYYTSDSGISTRISAKISKNIIHSCTRAINATYDTCNYEFNIAIKSNIIHDNSNISNRVINVHKYANVDIQKNTIFDNDGIAIYLGDVNLAYIDNNHIVGNHNGIYILEDWYQDYVREYHITENTIGFNNNFGIKQEDTRNSPGEFTNLVIHNNTIEVHDVGIELGDGNLTDISNNLIYENTSAISFIPDNSITLPTPFDVKLSNNTIVANNYAINSSIANATILQFKNNILWNNSISNIYYSVTPSVGTIGLYYNCIEDLNTLPTYVSLITGNIDDDPIFTDPSSDDYSLQISSPCIDAASYTSIDPDGTIADMGYEYCEQVSDSRDIKSGWNWISFPRLRVDSSEEALSWKVLTILQPSLPSSITVLDDDPTSSGQTYDAVNFWHPLGYTFDRISGYKINCPSAQALTLTVPGERVAENTTITLDAGVENWVGYFCEQSSSPETALAEIWDDFEMVKHKDWVYYRTQPGGRVYKTITSISGSGIKPGFRYGEMAVIKVYTLQHLTWSYDNVPVMSYPVSEVFTFEEKADYTPIHVELEENTDATEVGVFVGEECKGFGIVTEDEAMIRAYLDETRDGGGELDFVYFNGGRSQDSASNYTVYDQQLKAMVKRKINSSEGREFYNVSLKKDGSSEMVPNPMLTMNAYPNPFNPTTHISFYAPETEEAKVEIYNIKGQKVKTLFVGIAHSGKNLLVWNGIDDANQAVGSGIYFCRITTAHEETSKKLMLLK